MVVEDGCGGAVLAELCWRGCAGGRVVLLFHRPQRCGELRVSVDVEEEAGAYGRISATGIHRVEDAEEGGGGGADLEHLAVG